jgi:hypothetical protein
MIIVSLIFYSLLSHSQDVFCSEQKIIVPKKKAYKSVMSAPGKKVASSTELSTRSQALLVHTRYPQLLQAEPYNPHKTRNLYDATKPYRLSRSQLQNFLKCERCFYRNHILHIKDEPSLPFSINNAVDALSKKEFDQHRQTQTVPEIFAEKGYSLVPFNHPNITQWQDQLHHGLEHAIPGTNFIGYGGIDDMMQDPVTKKIFLIDHKATSKQGTVTIDAPWQDGYKQQIEIYQYLAEKNGLDVADTSYFVYSNARKDLEGFHNRLEFTRDIIPYEGDRRWVEQAFIAAYHCLQGTLPMLTPSCAQCQTFKAIQEKIEQKDS